MWEKWVICLPELVMVRLSRIIPPFPVLAINQYLEHKLCSDSLSILFSSLAGFLPDSPGEVRGLSPRLQQGLQRALCSLTKPSSFLAGVFLQRQTPTRQRAGSHPSRRCPGLGARGRSAETTPSRVLSLARWRRYRPMQTSATATACGTLNTWEK